MPPNKSSLTGSGKGVENPAAVIAGMSAAIAAAGQRDQEMSRIMIEATNDVHFAHDYRRELINQVQQNLDSGRRVDESLLLTIQDRNREIQEGTDAFLEAEPKYNRATDPDLRNSVVVQIALSLAELNKARAPRPAKRKKIGKRLYKLRE